MTYEFEIKNGLGRKLKKIKKKDTPFFQAVKQKIAQIVQHPTHYKPLKGDMKGIRRVHVKTSFVLIFTVDEKSKLVSFIDLDHHDVIYKKKRVQPS